MGIYSRDYYRELTPSPWSFDRSSVVKYLILLNIFVFLLQILIVRTSPAPSQDILDSIQHSERDSESYRRALEMVRASQQISVVQQWFELDSNKVVYGGQIWRLLTHAFCHDRHSIFHILFNMLLLFWFGRTLELMYGSREFLLFYLTSAVAGGIAYVGMDLYTGSNVPAIGASGAVMALMVLYTVHFPRETILVFYVIPVEMRFLMALYAMWDLHPILLILAGDPVWTGVAHAAHLGGLAFGFLYGHYAWRLERLGDRFSGLSVGTKSRPRLRLLHPEPPETRSYPDARRLDEVLEKISSRGQDSLTEEERTILRAASEKLRTRARDS